MEIQLASMENVTCWAFRKLMQGVTDSYTGIFSMNYLITRAKAWREIDTFKIENQRQWIQVATSKEKECSDFLKEIDLRLKLEPEKDNVYGLQLNLSCPSPNIIKIGQGPALIKRTKKVASLLNELLKQDKYKISLKTRLGLNETELREKKILNLFSELETIKDKNFTEVVVHFKHAKQSSSLDYDYSLLKELADFDIPLVINGGIKTYTDFNNIMKTLNSQQRRNIKGLMIGREALKNPDCFVGISNMLNNTLLNQRTLEQINIELKALCQEHIPKDIYINRIKELCSWNQ
jgi:tRNA-dihydrouridine synthase